MLKILFLEDDPIISDIILEYLTASHYSVDYAFDIKEAISFYEKNRYDIFVFDVNLPDGCSFELLELLRNSKNQTPTLFITALSDINSMKKGFESGCDDYIKKPFELDELELRLNNIKRLYNLESTYNLDTKIVLDKSKSIIVIENKEYTLSHKEIAILEYLSKNSDRLVSSEELIANIWVYDEMPTNATIRTYIKNLRHILGTSKIFNLRGAGYRFIKE